MGTWWEHIKVLNYLLHKTQFFLKFAEESTFLAAEDPHGPATLPKHSPFLPTLDVLQPHFMKPTFLAFFKKMLSNNS